MGARSRRRGLLLSPEGAVRNPRHARGLGPRSRYRWRLTMSEQVQDEVEGLETTPRGNGEADGELVHWMEPKPIEVGVTGVSIAVVGGFALGVGATLAVLALTDWFSPERVVEVPVGRRRG